MMGTASALASPGMAAKVGAGCPAPDAIGSPVWAALASMPVPAIDASKGCDSSCGNPTVRHDRRRSPFTRKTTARDATAPAARRSESNASVNVCADSIDCIAVVSCSRLTTAGRSATGAGRAACSRSAASVASRRARANLFVGLTTNVGELGGALRGGLILERLQTAGTFALFQLALRRHPAPLGLELRFAPAAFVLYHVDALTQAFEFSRAAQTLRFEFGLHAAVRGLQLGVRETNGLEMRVRAVAVVNERLHALGQRRHLGLQPLPLRFHVPRQRME